MKNTTLVSLLLAAIVVGCGSQLVLFPDQENNPVLDAGLSDANDDASDANVVIILPPQPDASVPFDASPGLDAAKLLDAGEDTNKFDSAVIDSGFDASEDVGFDAAEDANKPDAAVQDAGFDASEDARDADVKDAEEKDARCSHMAIDLGSSSGFAVLAYSTVTSSGNTMITGDLGLWTGSSVTGFPPGQIVGNEYLADPTSQLAMGSATTAYNNAAGLTLCSINVAGNLGGQTLSPGLYNSTSSLAVSSGNLTLDGQGDPNAVFIFQMASTLTITDGLQVILAGGAQSSNIFWQVGSSATLDGTSSFEGTIMAEASISMLGNAVLNGRALALNGGVTMIDDTITLPAL